MSRSQSYLIVFATHNGNQIHHTGGLVERIRHSFRKVAHWQCDIHSNSSRSRLTRKGGRVVPRPAGKVPLPVKNARFLGTDLAAFICKAGHRNSTLGKNIASFLLDTNRGSTEVLGIERPQRKTDCSRRRRID